MNSLPLNWYSAALSDVCCRIVDGSHNPPKGAESGHAMLSARNIINQQIVFDEFRYITEADFLTEHARTQIAQGDVLLTIVGTIGRVAVVPEQLPPFALQRSVAVLKPRQINSRYLAYALEAPAQQQWLVDNAKGTAQKGVYLKTLGSAHIPVAPLAEQTRIVEKLDELLSDLDAGVAELKAAQRKLAQYRQSLLKAAVEGALTADWRAARQSKIKTPISSFPRKRESTGSKAPAAMDFRFRGNDGRSDAALHSETGAELLQRILIERRTRWEAKRLAKFAEQGKTPPNDWKAKYPEPAAPNTTDLPALPEGWAWTSVDQLSPDDLANGRSVPSAEVGARVLRLTSVKSGRIDLAECKIGNWSEGEAKPFAVVQGDLLIIRGNGSLSLVGRAGLVPEVHEQVAYPDTMIRLRVIDSVVRTGWVGLLWDADITRKHLERRARTSAGIYKISQPDIVSVRLPVPPLHEQDKILKLFEQSCEAMQSIEAMLEHALKQSTAQRKNILKAAFAGQLVAQDPNDEPAKALLERIRAERISVGAKRAGKNGRKPKEKA